MSIMAVMLQYLETRMSKYKVLSRESKNLLEDAVNSSIVEGWIPQGGIHVISHGVHNFSVYYQAMIKKDKGPFN